MRFGSGKSALLVLLHPHVRKSHADSLPCRRTYDANVFDSSWNEVEYISNLKNDRESKCPKNANVQYCTHDASSDIPGLKNLTYSVSQEIALQNRTADVLPVMPTPTLAVGRPLFAYEQQTLGEPDPVFFYGVGYTDLSLFTRFFRAPSPVTGGVYLEIGGSNGWHASNTLFFEQHLNWTGFLIEPTPCGACMLPYTRPRDVTINAGCCMEPTTLNGSFMRRFCLPPQDNCLRSREDNANDFNPRCEPMSSLLRMDQSPKTRTGAIAERGDGSVSKDLPEHLDLVSVDVEENYMDVLLTLPWDETAIDVLTVEVTVARKPGERRRSLERTVRQKEEKTRTENWLKTKGYRLLRMGFNNDIVAVRRKCVV